jgi:hypothetical protein
VHAHKWGFLPLTLEVVFRRWKLQLSTYSERSPEQARSDDERMMNAREARVRDIANIANIANIAIELRGNKNGISTLLGAVE